VLSEAAAAKLKNIKTFSASLIRAHQEISTSLIYLMWFCVFA
jgi:hypothetical protein